MKKLIFLMFIMALVSCKVDEPKPFELKPDAYILLKPDAKAWANAPQYIMNAKVTGLTPLQIVEQGINIKWQSHYFGNAYCDPPKTLGRTFSVNQRDLTIPALKMLSIDILYKEQRYLPIAIYRDLIYGYNVYITDMNNDTIACVPDSVITNARVSIETAFEAKNYDEIYRLFNEAFTFQPIK